VIFTVLEHPAGIDGMILFYNRDRLFIILTQYKKLGSLVAVCRETANTYSICGEVYQVR